MAEKKPSILSVTESRLRVLNAVIQALATSRPEDRRTVLEAAAVFYDVTVNVTAQGES